MIGLMNWCILVRRPPFQDGILVLTLHPVQSEAEYNYRPFRSVWFSMALCDGSAFKLCMANAAMFLDEVRHPNTFHYENSRETLAYYGEGVNQVTRRLADRDDCVSEGLITTVLGFICHDVRLCPEDLGDVLLTLM